MTSASIQATSGAIGSSLSNLLVFPLDVATVRAQIERDHNKRKYENVVLVFLKMLKNEGPSAFFQGAGDDLAATALQSFLYFFVYNKLRNKQLKPKQKLLAVHRELITGALAGVVCKLFTTPLKNIVLMKQLTPTHKSFFECLRRIYKLKGITGFWAGYKSTFILSINPSLAYYFYQLLGAKHRLAIVVFIRAALAKSMALLLTYPLILAKTRTQAGKKGETVLNELINSLKLNGVSSLYDGVEGQLVKGIFSQGIAMATKEKIEHLLLLAVSNK